MTVCLLTPDPKTKEVAAIEAKLKDLIPELRKIGKVEEITAEITEGDSGKVIVIFVSPILATAGIDNFINISKRYHERLFFILVTNEISASDYKRLIRSGGADWVAAGSSLQEIAEIIHKQSARLGDDSAAANLKKRPTIVSFLPSMGGVGNTTIALEAALHIKRAKESRKRKICYVDLDFQTSHVCDYLDTEARLQVHEIVDQPERLDEQLFELFVSHHSSGLDIIASPRTKLNPCDISIDALDALLDMAMRRYDYLVVALPVIWFSWTLPTLKNSDAVIITGLNTIPCLRQIRYSLDAVNDAKNPTSAVAIVINRAAPNFFGRIKRRNHVESVLAKEKIFYVREDPLAVERVNAGTPAALGGSSRHAEDFVKIGSFCMGIKQRIRTNAAR